MKGTYALFMPGEERIFFRNFHVIAIATLTILLFLGVFVSGMSILDALVVASIVVLPMYVVRLMYGKRFAESVMIDFDNRTVRFSFSDERGSFERAFEQIKHIKFKFYLTFVLEDQSVMIKRPANKKEVYQRLKNVSRVDSGLFEGI
ncbi:MAG: hypothetical protein RBS57_13370 [Desulforhabdus sp.]|nr:hypothetical protein [Desulforhabdus sp.]